MLTVSVSDTTLNALHISTHLDETETIIIVVIYKWGHQGQERLSNSPQVAARQSRSRVWALYHEALLACLLYGGTSMELSSLKASDRPRGVENGREGCRGMGRRCGRGRG